jgi:hypothetical protein
MRIWHAIFLYQSLVWLPSLDELYFFLYGGKLSWNSYLAFIDLRNVCKEFQCNLAMTNYLMQSMMTTQKVVYSVFVKSSIINRN